MNDGCTQVQAFGYQLAIFGYLNRSMTAFKTTCQKIKRVRTVQSVTKALTVAVGNAASRRSTARRQSSGTMRVLIWLYSPVLDLFDFDLIKPLITQQEI